METRFGEVDAYLFGQGVHYRLYERLGAHPCTQDGVAGTRFAVWAPRAMSVSVIGDFNQWNENAHPLHRCADLGVWEGFVSGVKQGERYKFALMDFSNHVRHKSDPFATHAEQRPGNASIVWDVNPFSWQHSLERPKVYPLNIYEVHLGSWRQKEGHFMNYRELAHSLAAYCIDMGYTHVELLPIMEHPLDESWGYQVTGFFAATSRHGTPSDFQYFVDHLHGQGLGVILDWVPAHFPTDAHGLAQFDGEYRYEYADPKQGFHPHWNTHIFDYGCAEVKNFLIASALFWLDKMHVDGLRVDAVASMLYLDYGRRHGEWIPNQHGGHENLDAIEFLKHLNSIVHQYFPHALMIAEESTTFSGISHPLDRGGLGFDMKWKMGWMNDTLKYFQTDPLYRSHHQNLLTFGLVYAFSERFLLPLSHDEVVHGKASLLAKMPGDDWQKFANLRLLCAYQICQPGKKLCFMGAELGQWEEWNCKKELRWDLLAHERHAGLHACFKELYHFYRETPALWQKDFDPEGFAWVDCSDFRNSVISYLRKGDMQCMLCIHNFTPLYHPRYFIRLRGVQTLVEKVNTDEKRFGGSGLSASPVTIHADGIELALPPLATVIMEVNFEKRLSSMD